MEDRAHFENGMEGRASARLRGKSLHSSEVAQCALLPAHINERRSNGKGLLSHGAQIQSTQPRKDREGERCPFELGMSMSLMKNRIILWDRDVMQRSVPT